MAVAAVTFFYPPTHQKVLFCTATLVALRILPQSLNEMRELLQCLIVYLSEGNFDSGKPRSCGPNFGPDNRGYVGEILAQNNWGYRSQIFTPNNRGNVAQIWTE